MARAARVRQLVLFHHDPDHSDAAVSQIEQNAKHAFPETTEASLQLAENTLVDLGVPMGVVLASIHERRDEFRRMFQAATPVERRGRPTRALRSRATPAPPPHPPAETPA